MNWKYLVIGLCAFIMIFHISALIYIRGNDYELTSKDYYAQELRYQHQMDRLQAGSEFDWDCRFEDNRFVVRVRSDQHGVALEDVRLQLYRPHDAKQDQTLGLTEVEPGVYEQALTTPAPGRWNLTVEGLYKGRAVAWQEKVSL